MNPLTGKNRFLMKRYLYPKQQDTYNYSYEEHDQINERKGVKKTNERLFRYDTMEEKESMLARARNVALTALQQYDLAWERIQFIHLSDTITYKIETSTPDSYLLRIHSDRWSKEEIQS